MSTTQPALPPWPVGPFITEAREKAKMSKVDLARRAGISAAKVQQLETGYSVQSGVKVPVGTTKSTIERVAQALGVNVDEALTLAGFLPNARHPVRVDLTHVTDADLIAELERRLSLRGRRTPR